MKGLKKAVTFCLVIGLVMALALPLWAQEVEKININQASVEDLAQLKRIGLKYAERIVEYREKHGPFESVEDIINVPGIGRKTLEANEDRMTVE